MIRHFVLRFTALVIVVSLPAYGRQPLDQSAGGPTRLPAIAPAFVLPDTYGKPVRSEDLFAGASAAGADSAARESGRLTVGSYTEPGSAPSVPIAAERAPGEGERSRQIERSAEGRQGARVLVLNFWAFWCDTWKAELPHLRDLATRQDEVGFRLAAVSVDGTRLAEFRRLTHDSLPFPVLLDAGGVVSAAYQVAHVPTVVIIDAAGRICFTSVGYPGNDVVLHQVKRAASNSGGAVPRP